MNQIFQDKLDGKYGVGEQISAQRTLNIVEKEYADGEIYINDDGVPLNILNRPVCVEIRQVLQYLNVPYDEEASQEAYSKYLLSCFNAFSVADEELSDETRAEMRNAFGEDTKVINVITGKEMIV